MTIGYFCGIYVNIYIFFLNFIEFDVNTLVLNEFSTIFFKNRQKFPKYICGLNKQQPDLDDFEK